LVCFVVCALGGPSICRALMLNGAGPATQLTGTLGTVDAVSVDDSPLLAGYLGSMGLVDLDMPIPIQRVQYDLLNNAGNGSIFEFRVDFPVGTNVLGAGNPSRYIDSAGMIHTQWGGSNHTLLFDNGFGIYNYDQDFGGEWRIIYAPDHVTWEHLGNGFLPDTATGRTDLGVITPTFRIVFDPDTRLGFQPAEVSGFVAGVGAVAASGMVLSAVPEPSAFVMLALMSLALVGVRRRV
jgi:hypothetical protein